MSDQPPSDSTAPDPKAPKSKTRGWDGWHRPKVLLPLLAVCVMVAGVAATLFTSRPSENRQGDTFNGPVGQRQPEPTVPNAVTVDPPASKGAPGPKTAAATRKHNEPRAKVAEPNAPQREVSAATGAPAQQPTINNSTIVSNSPNAITFGHVNANTIEVRPPR